MWPKISKENVVDIIAPSGAISEADVQAIHHYLVQAGFRPRIPENILGDHPITGATDEVRFQHLKKALSAEDSTLIWCARGGHGLTRIMPDFMQLPKPSKQKLLVGFSDVTSLHLGLNQIWQWPSLHGPMVRLAALDKLDVRDVQALNHLWFDGLAGYVVSDLQPLNETAQQLKSLEAVTCGGCLTVLQTSIGTAWQLDAKNKILLLEDVNEPAYRIDRALVHLANAGMLDQTKAIIIGDLSDQMPEENAFSLVLQDVLNHYFPKRGLSLPVFRLSGFGHGKRNKPVPLGVEAKIICIDGSWELNFFLSL